MNRSLLLSLLSLAAPLAPCAAQSDSSIPLVIGRSISVRSRVLGETRIVDVALPRGYNPQGERRYPVLFVLDGEFEGQPAMAIAQFYAAMSQLPPTIVVGVRNTDRMRDMTPPPLAGFLVPPEAANAGGADQFLSFLADELLPLVDREYRTAPMRVLIGHSLTGLFVLHALSRRPELFTGYVAMEPSVWWNDRRPVEDVQRTLATRAARRVRLMMVNGDAMGMDTAGWGGSSPMVRSLRVEGETHSSMAMTGMMVALRSLFEDFRPLAWRPGLSPLAMLDRYDSLAERIGYAAPIPADAYERVARMLAHSRDFENAERTIERLVRAYGASAASRGLYDLVASERAHPQAASFIPLTIPARRPGPREAGAFLGLWESVGSGQPHYVRIRASGDTIVVRDSLQMGNGDWFVQNDPAIQLAGDGRFEWGLPFFRGVAALLVLRGRLLEDGTMEVTREARGFIPRQAGPDDLMRSQRFRRIGS